ncbi:MAG: 4Fe-4S binding protein [Chloroflexota bacterium]
MRIQAQDELCAGCKLCQLTCALSRYRENNPKKTAIKVWSQHFTNGHYHVAVCSQCGHCAEVCPVGAITMVDGAYRIDEETCTQCLLCVDECPENAMFTHPEIYIPIKCILCKECVAICPTKALSVVE